MAIAAALLPGPHRERNSAFIAVGISCLSALAMITYPMLAHWMGLDPHRTGEFLGGTIHDVAQAVGAGLSVSEEAGQVATLVRLSRVALLLPLVGAIVLLVRWRQSAQHTTVCPPAPWFLLGFVAFAALRNTVELEPMLLGAANSLSKGLTAMAIAAIGMKLRPQSVLAMGARPIVVITSTTMALALGYLLLLGSAPV